jgi:hypothetical protein
LESKILVQAAEQVVPEVALIKCRSRFFMDAEKVKKEKYLPNAAHFSHHNLTSIAFTCYLWILSVGERR